MKCIIGLGNPGRKYKKTRHNIGFMVIDELAKRNRWKLKQTKFKSVYTIENLLGEKVLFLQPQTFMNLSGEAVEQFMNFYKLALDDLLVIYDDLDLPVGKIRLRKKGGHGGHNGMRSIIKHVQTNDFKRIRIGIGRPTKANLSIVDYVLRPFDRQEKEEADLSIQTAADACEKWLQTSFDEAMNQFNH